MAKPTVEEAQKELKFREKQSQSGWLTALVASLSNDDEARADYLREKRFPQNPNVVYFTDEENDMAYVDPNTNEIKKEFYDYTDWVDSYDIFGKIVPGIQLAAEVVGGAIGLAQGYRNAPFKPSKAAGRAGAGIVGVAGTGLGGDLVYGARDILSRLVDGPEMNYEKLREDLMYSGLFGGVPLGIGKNASLIRKFDYSGGSDDLSMLLQLAQDTDAQAAAQWYKEKTGVDILASEVNYALKDPIRLQRYIQNQNSGSKLRNFYETRNLQIEDTIDSYLDVLQKGTYVTGRASEKITGVADANPSITVRNISEDVIKEMASKRKARFLRELEVAKGETDLYIRKESGEMLPMQEQVQIKELLDNMTPQERSAYLRQQGYKETEELLKIDTSPVIKKLDDMINDADSSAVRIKTAKDIKKLFYNADGTPKDTVGSLHGLKAEDLGNIVSEAGPKGSTSQNAIASDIKETLNLLIKEYSPSYSRATTAYNPEKNHLQILEKGVVGVLGKLVGDDMKLAKTVQRMFKGQASEREVRAFRRLVQTKDPQAFQNLKHMFLSDELANAGSFLQFTKKVGFGNLDPRYINAQRAKDFALDDYTKALNEFGQNSQQAKVAGSKLRVVKESFKEAEKYLDQRKRVYKSLLSEEEFDAFVLLNDTIQRASFVAKQSDSMTQPFSRQREAIVESGVGMLGRGADFAIKVLDFVNLKNSRSAYKNKIADETESQMIDLLLNPASLDEVVEGLQVVRPYVYATAQGAFRTPSGSGESSLGDIEEETIEGQVDQAKRRLQELQSQKRDNLNSQLDSALQGFQPSNIPLVPPANAIRPQDMINETILPNPKDRELAERQMMRSSGIGSLA
jgi:hypothetical protein